MTQTSESPNEEGFPCAVKVYLPSLDRPIVTEMVRETEDEWVLRDHFGTWSLSKDIDGMVHRTTAEPDWQVPVRLRRAGRSAMMRSRRIEGALSGQTRNDHLVVVHGNKPEPTAWEKISRGSQLTDKQRAARGRHRTTGDKPWSGQKVYRMKPGDTVTETGQLVRGDGKVKQVQHTDKWVIRSTPDGTWEVVRKPEESK